MFAYQPIAVFHLPNIWTTGHQNEVAEPAAKRTGSDVRPAQLKNAPSECEASMVSLELPKSSKFVCFAIADDLEARVV